MKDLASIRNDVVGSLLRPVRLKEARMQYDEGRQSLAELRSVEDQCIRDAVRLQEEAGLKIVTDGEYRRLNFQDSFGESVSGFDAGRPSLKFYVDRIEGSKPLQRWEIPDRGENKATAVAQRRPVVIGLVDGENIEILSGLKPGELIITQGHSTLRDGTPISVSAP